MDYRRIGLLVVAMVLVTFGVGSTAGLSKLKSTADDVSDLPQVPANWWTEHNVSLPQGMSIFEGRVYRIIENRIYFRWTTCNLSAATEIYNTNHQEGWGDPTQFDGRRLSVAEFRQLVVDGDAPPALTIYGKPTVAREMLATRIEFGHADLGPDEWYWGNHAHYGFIAEDQQGMYLGTWKDSRLLAAVVSDEEGAPLINADGTYSQLEKLPLLNDSVRVLIYNGEVIRMVKNPPPRVWPEGQEPGPDTWTHDGQVGKIDLQNNAYWWPDRTVQVSDQTQFFDQFGLSFTMNDLGSLLQQGVAIQVTGPYDEQTGDQLAQMLEIIDHQRVDWPERQVDRYLVDAYEPADANIRTLHPWERYVAVDAPIVDRETGREIDLALVRPGTPVQTIEQQPAVDEIYPFPYVILRMEVGADELVEPPADRPIIEIYGEATGDVAFVGKVFSEGGGLYPGERWIVTDGIRVQTNEQTRLFDRDGFPIDLADIEPRSVVLVDPLASTDPTTLLAREIVTDDPPGDEILPLFTNVVLRVEEDAVVMQGLELWLEDNADVQFLDTRSGKPLTPEIKLFDSITGEDLALEDFALGDYIRYNVLLTSRGLIVTQVERDPPRGGPQFYTWEEDREIYRANSETGEIIYVDAELLLTDETRVTDRDGIPIKLLDIALGTPLVVEQEFSAAADRWVALWIEIQNFNKQYGGENVLFPTFGGIEDDRLIALSHPRWLAFDADILDGAGRPAAIDELVQGVPVRATIQIPPAGVSTPFNQVVTRIIINPQEGGGVTQPVETREVTGTVVAVDRFDRTLELEPTALKIERRTEIVDAVSRDELDLFDLQGFEGELLAANFFPAPDGLRATRIVALDPDHVPQVRSNLLVASLLEVDQIEGIIYLRGPIVAVTDQATREIRLADGSLGDFEDIEVGDEVRLQILAADLGAVATRIKVTGGFEGPIFGGGGLEIVSVFPAPGATLVPIDTEIEVSFNEPVRDLLDDVDFALGLFPWVYFYPSISHDGRTIVLEDVSLQENTAYQLYVLSERFGLFTFHFTTGGVLPTGTVEGHVELPSDISFGLIAPEESGVFLMNAEILAPVLAGEVEDEGEQLELFLRSVTVGTHFDERGDYRFEHVPAGNYLVLAEVGLEFGPEEQLELEAYFDADGDGEADAITVSGSLVEQVDIDVVPPAALAVRATAPAQGATQVNTETTIALVFNDPLRTDDLGKPIVDVLIYPRPLSGQPTPTALAARFLGSSLSFDVALEEDTNYSLMVFNAETESRLRLEEAVVVHFSTGAGGGGTISGRLALPEQLPPERVIGRPAVLALVPFNEFDAFNPQVGDLAIAGALSYDGSYAFEEVPAGRYVVMAGVPLALPPSSRLPQQGLRADFTAFEGANRFSSNVPSDFANAFFFGYSQDEAGEPRADVRAGSEGVEILLKPEDARRSALRVVSVDPDPEALQEAPVALDITVQFSEPLVVQRDFVELEAIMRPLPLSGPVMDDFAIAEDGQSIIFRDVELAPGESYRLFVQSARGVSGQELAEPYILALRTAGAEAPLAGAVSGWVLSAGDEISAASVFLYDPTDERLEVLAGALVDEDGFFAVGDVPVGDYAAYAQIQTVGGSDLLVFFDEDGDGDPDVFAVGGGLTEGIRFEIEAVVATEDTVAQEVQGPNTAAVVSLDLSPSSGNQHVDKLEVGAEQSVELEVYGSGLTDVTGVSIVVQFDATQINFTEATEAGSGEFNLLKSEPGAVVLFLPARLRENVAEFGGAILSPTVATAARGEGLLGVLHFETLAGYSGATLTLDQVIFNALGGVQDTVRSAPTALVTPPLELLATEKGPFFFDFDPGAGELLHLGEVEPGQEVQVQVYANDVEQLVNYSIKVLFNPDQLSYVTLSGENFLAAGGGVAIELNPLVSEQAVEFGGALMGPTAATAMSGSHLICTLTFTATESFSETDLVIVKHSTKVFGGEQIETESSIFARLSTEAIDLAGGTASGARSADFDGSGTVDFGDFFLFADAFGVTDPDPRFDLDEDGRVGFGDFFLFADAFGRAAKAVAAELPRKAGRLNLEARSDQENIELVLRADQIRLRGYVALIEYDPELFRLAEVSDAGSVLRTDRSEVLMLNEETPGRMLIAGSRTGGAKGVEGLLVQMRFEPLRQEAVGLFRVSEALLRRDDGRLVRPRQLGQVEARWVPQSYALFSNYPNPFNPSTAIRYQLPVRGMVQLVIYDALGQRMRTLADGEQAAGFHRTMWHGRDDDGRAVAAGVYFYRMRAGGFEQVRKLLLVK